MFKQILKNFKNKSQSEIHRTPIYHPMSDELIAEYNLHRPHGARPVLCYAPFKNIYFGHHGKAIACCYNRTHFLGSYPQQSIKEIWQSNKANELRNYIKNNDLSLGCYGCKNHLEGRNFDALKTKMYDYLSLNENFPTVLELELNNTCNLECIMCSGDFSSEIRKNRENKPKIESLYDSNFVKQLEEFIPYLENIKFYGGEPFLIDIYYEIWEKVISLNPYCNLTIQTNATILNTKVKDLLSKARFHINISIDSLQKENYEKIRINAKFEKVMENILYFHEYCKKKNTFFGISVCAIRQNWQEMPAFVNYCNHLDTPLYIHTVWFPPMSSLWNSDSSKLNEIHDYLSNFEFPSETEIQKKNNAHFHDFVSMIDSWHKKALLKEQEILSETQDVRTQKKLLFRSIKSFIETKEELSKNDRKVTYTKCINKLEKVMRMFENNELLERAFKQMREFPLDMIVPELISASEDRIYEEIKSFIYNLNYEIN
jgi:MoaA/NifB/PqqE/SkfB family radical SAM enzyme